MVKPVCIEYTLQELEAGTIESMGFDRNSFTGDKGSIKAYLIRAEDFPPVRLIQRLRPLVLDEAVAPKDIVISIVDSDNGRHFYYNIEKFLEDTLGNMFSARPLKEKLRSGFDHFSILVDSFKTLCAASPQRPRTLLSAL